MTCPFFQTKHTQTLCLSMSTQVGGDTRAVRVHTLPFIERPNSVAEKTLTLVTYPMQRCTLRITLHTKYYYCCSVRQQVARTIHIQHTSSKYMHYYISTLKDKNRNGISPNERLSTVWTGQLTRSVASSSRRLKTSCHLLPRTNMSLTDLSFSHYSFLHYSFPYYSTIKQNRAFKSVACLEAAVGHAPPA